LALSRVLYYIFIIPVSLLPYPLLYGLSNLFFYIIYYGIGYRKSVVISNIDNSFPNRSAQEKKEIAKKFYRHFCDLTLESLKVFTISKKEVQERMVFNHVDVINKYFDQGRSVIIAGGHYNNWELFAVGVADAIKHEAFALYAPLTNKFFDGKMRQTRSKYGLRMISTKLSRELFQEEQKKGTLFSTVFGIDQSPGNPNKCYWTTFLNQDTGILFGVEKFAKEYNQPVVFGRINKVKRGYYSFDFIDVTDQPQQTAYGEITEKVTRILEDDINLEPCYWLWSHKRWKHKRPTDYKVGSAS
jgi:Kdo2-lipid IVA lauroyltransferase/acyltransferase